MCKYINILSCVCLLKQGVIAAPEWLYWIDKRPPGPLYRRLSTSCFWQTIQTASNLKICRQGHTCICIIYAFSTLYKVTKVCLHWYLSRQQQLYLNDWCGILYLESIQCITEFCSGSPDFSPSTRWAPSHRHLTASCRLLSDYCLS